MALMLRGGQAGCYWDQACLGQPEQYGLRPPDFPQWLTLVDGTEVCSVPRLRGHAL
jgi:hypothetical protein